MFNSKNFFRRSCGSESWKESWMSWTSGGTTFTCTALSKNAMITQHGACRTISNQSCLSSNPALCPLLQVTEMGTEFHVCYVFIDTLSFLFDWSGQGVGADPGSNPDNSLFHQYGHWCKQTFSANAAFNLTICKILFLSINRPDGISCMLCFYPFYLSTLLNNMYGMKRI